MEKVGPLCCATFFSTNGYIWDNHLTPPVPVLVWILASLSETCLLFVFGRSIAKFYQDT